MRTVKTTLVPLAVVMLIGLVGWAVLRARSAGPTTAVVRTATPDPSGPSLSPALLAIARQTAGRGMSAAGSAQAVEADFATVAAVAWPGERVFGDAQDSYLGHRIMVVQVSQNVTGFMRQPPPRQGEIRTPIPLGGIQVFYDETLDHGISTTAWEAGKTAPFALSRLGQVVTFDVRVDDLKPGGLIR
jgi:hypothetical protein